MLSRSAARWGAASIAILLLFGAIALVLSDPESGHNGDSSDLPTPAEHQREDDDAMARGAQRPRRGSDGRERVDVDAPREPTGASEATGTMDVEDTQAAVPESSAESPRQQGPNPFGERNPEKLRAVAEEMHVGETVIVAALHAEGLVRRVATERVDKTVSDEAKRAVADLSGFGVEGYRGVLAMLRAGYQGTWFLELIEATYQPGYESELIAVAGDEEVAEFSRWGALVGLQVADTPAVREFLRAFLRANQDDPGLFMSAALALGELHDAQSAQLVRGKFFLKGWNGVHGDLVHALGGMGGDDARDILVGFIRDDRATRVARAFRSLARVDLEAARDEAERFLESARGKKLAGYERTTIQNAIEGR